MEALKMMNQISRRTLITGGAISVGGSVFPVPFFRNLPRGISPLVAAQGSSDLFPTKDNNLTVLSRRPVNIETPVHLLNDEVTPAEKMFVRNNGLTPQPEAIDPSAWTLEIDGEVTSPQTFSIDRLKQSFETITLRLQLECGGNGRRFFDPGANGNQWTFGAISCGEWTGVRLADVLDHVGLKSSAIYTAHYGADAHLSGDATKNPLSRGIPISKAMDPHNLIAWALNGEDIPLLNGHPLRLVVPGWPGSCSQKWLNRITLRDQEHDGAKMTGQSYRIPAYPVAPGSVVPDQDMRIIESMPVKSLITAPRTGIRANYDEALQVTGHAWAGDHIVSDVETSIDFGATWQKAHLSPPANPYAWQQWSSAIRLPQPGYFEVWAKATDSEGRSQPAVPPSWNPRGYLNNMQHRIAVFGV